MEEGYTKGISIPVHALISLTAVLVMLVCASARGGNWVGPEIIETDPKTNRILTQHEPRVSFYQQGKAIALFGWNRFDLNEDIGHLYGRVFGGSRWSEAERIDGHTGIIWSSQVASNSIGNVIAVFEQDGPGAGHRIYATVWNRVAIGGPSIIDAGTGHESYDPQIAVDNRGNAISVFSQSDGDYGRIYANRWNGSKWEGAEIIDASTGYGAGYGPEIAFDSDGNAIAVFGQVDRPISEGGVCGYMRTTGTDQSGRAQR